MKNADHKLILQITKTGNKQLNINTLSIRNNGLKMNKTSSLTC